MEDSKFVAFFLVVSFLWILPFFVLAYDDNTTHPAITREVIKFFNHYFPVLRIPDNEARKVIQGSVDEDRAPRWLKHFYDPVDNRGLVLTRDELLRDRELAAVVGGLESEWMSSKDWARNTVFQAGSSLASLWLGIFTPYFSGELDHSWDRAIYEYAWGDKSRGLESLGHVLHLLEDATVPDHTRNDAHPPALGFGSPYELWTKRFNESNIDIADSLVRENENVTLLASLDSYFNSLASFSNKNFFSADTIFASDYREPVVNFEGEFGYRQVDGDRIPIVRRLSTEEYTIADRDYLILSNYWSRLSKQAVLHGAGVVKLFFDEVEKEKQTKTLLRKNQSLLSKIIDAAWRKIVQFVNFVRRVAIAVAQEIADMAGAIGKKVDEIIQKGREQIFGAAALIFGIEVLPEGSLPPVVVIGPEPLPPGAFPDPGEVPPLPEIPPQANPGPFPQEPPIDIAPGEPRPPTPAEPESPNPAPRTPGPSVPNTPPSEPSPAPTPAVPPTEPPLTPEATSSPPTPEPTPPEENPPPDVLFTIAECGGSFSPEGCLVATTTLTALWSSSAGDIDHYVVECEKSGSPCLNFFYDPGATSTQFTAEDNSDYIFRAKAVDTAGNESAFVEKAVSTNSMPVVINEIAWAGTDAATPQDEWLELFNRTALAVNLDGWILRSATDDKPYLHLAGSIGGRGYYLIERTDDNTVSDIAADLVAPFGSGSGTGLVDSGEVLVLEKASTTVDQTPPPETCGGISWCSGSVALRATMERVDPGLAGADPDSWATNDLFFKNGQSAGGLALNGTPKARNSRNFYVTKGNTLRFSKTLTKENSPYVVDGAGLTVAEGVTLTVKPGVVVKFFGGGRSVLEILGAIKAVGTAADPIVFTSMADDEYGGDLNRDATTTEPRPGQWQTVGIGGTSSGSELAYLRLRYGGQGTGAFPAGQALLRVEGTPVRIENSVLERSAAYGLWLVNSPSRILSSHFASNTSYGLFSEASEIEVRASIFENNAKGLVADRAGHSVFRGNTFTANRDEAMLVGGGAPVFAGNSASANGANGTVFVAMVDEDYVFEKDLPYIMRDTLTLAAGRRFRISPGVIFKFLPTGSFVASGITEIIGTADEPVVFTSLKDDEFGGDTNNDGGVTLPAAGDWRKVLFSGTASSSAISQAVFRYGGGFNTGALSVDSAEVNIADTVVEKNAYQGIYLNNASSTLSGLSIRDHGAGSVGGLYIENSSRVILSNSVFRNNRFGIVSSDSVFANGGGIDLDDSNETKTFPPDLLE